MCFGTQANGQATSRDRKKPQPLRGNVVLQQADRDSITIRQFRHLFSVRAMPRHLLSFHLCFLLIASPFSWTMTASVAVAQVVDQRPNVVWIMSEDNSKHYLRLFDKRGAKTPNIAAMAQHGIRFDRAFSNAPVCSVARTTLITGVFAPRLGTQFHRKIKPASLPTGWKMFPALLRDAGYFTSNNAKKDYNAFEGQGVWDQSGRNASWKNRQPSQPFFHVQTFTDSHESSLHFKQQWVDNPDVQTDPQQVTLPAYHPDTPLFRLTHARYHDRIKTIDQKVGALIEQLRKDRLLESTFVFYFGDHGGVLPRGKGYVYESGLHVPLVVRVPEKFKTLAPLSVGSSTDGFVQFVDFGPTVLNLAGVSVPNQMDGQPFLGSGISRTEFENRKSAFGYADRMDEKYDHCRSLRVGDWKYIRNYTPFYPDGLQNNYRYQMLAYRQWRERFKADQLTPIQAAFFQPRNAEQLFNLQVDPDETNNLADQPQHRQQLLSMRTKLAQTLDAMPDLSFYPENYLVDQGVLNDPIEFGTQHRKQIVRYREIADLALDQNDDQVAKLQSAAQSPDPVARYWAYIAASGAKTRNEKVAKLAAEAVASDSAELVRFRAAEFLGLVYQVDPMPTYRQLLKQSESSTLNLMVLQSVVMFRDGDFEFDTQLDTQSVSAIDSQTLRRIGYLDGLGPQEIKRRTRNLQRIENQKQKND